MGSNPIISTRIRKDSKVFIENRIRNKETKQIVVKELTIKGSLLREKLVIYFYYKLRFFRTKEVGTISSASDRDI